MPSSKKKNTNPHVDHSALAKNIGHLPLCSELCKYCVPLDKSFQEHLWFAACNVGETLVGILEGCRVCTIFYCRIVATCIMCSFCWWYSLVKAMMVFLASCTFCIHERKIISKLHRHKINLYWAHLKIIHNFQAHCVVSVICLPAPYLTWVP